LAPPTDTAAAAALALEAALSEQRGAAAQMESVSFFGGGGQFGKEVLGGDHAERDKTRTPPDQRMPRPQREAIPLEDLPKPRYRGPVKTWSEKGFGFIVPFDPAISTSLFAHASSIVPKMGTNAGDGPDALQDGAIVEFSLEVA